MPSLLRLPTQTIVLVCDARKALFLRNSGTAIHPSLEIVRTLNAESVTAERDLKGNPPGRKADIHTGTGAQGPKSAMEQTDYARLDEEAFAAAVAEECATFVGKGEAAGLVVAAPSRMLGALRQAMPEGVRQKLVAEVPKGLTQMPVAEIAGHLVEEW